MLEKEFFKMQAYNAGPYPVVNLGGNQKFEQNTVFRPGRYLIEVAPGLDSNVINNIGNSAATTSGFVYLKKEEIITERFMIRAYCGSNSTGSGAPGTNSYSGGFKVNGVDATLLPSSGQPVGIDVNHIFGAGSGNGYSYFRVSMVIPGGSRTITQERYIGGGGNCLGNGGNYLYSIVSDSSTGTTTLISSSGAGSCLHLLPIGGNFGTDYLRAYHLTGFHSTGSVYGGGSTPRTYIAPSAGAHISYWATRGGNSPYGTGGDNSVYGADGNGVGGGKQTGSACAYYNGASWVNDGIITNALTAGVPVDSSYIRVTYLGPLGS